MSLAEDQMRKLVSPWIGLAGGDTDYVKVDGVMFAVCTADVAVAPAYVAKTMAKYLPASQCVGRAEPASWGACD